jgi:hypothetical protein
METQQRQVLMRQPVAVGGKGAAGGIPSEYLTIILVVLVFVLLLILVVLGLIISVLKNI